MKKRAPRKSAFGDLQAAADRRHGDIDALAKAVRESAAEYRRRPSPERHRAIARAVGRLSCCVDPGGETRTSRLWRSRLGL